MGDTLNEIEALRRALRAMANGFPATLTSVEAEAFAEALGALVGRVRELELALRDIRALDRFGNTALMRAGSVGASKAASGEERDG